MDNHLVEPPSNWFLEVSSHENISLNYHCNVAWFFTDRKARRRQKIVKRWIKIVSLLEVMLYPSDL